MTTVSPDLNSNTGWTIGNGPPPIIGSGILGMSVYNSVAIYPALYTATPMITDNYFVQMTLANAPTAAQSMLILRGNTTFTTWVGAGIESGQVYIATYTSATSGQNKRATLSVSQASGNVFKFSVVGRAFTLFKNGVIILSWIDSGAVTSVGPTFRYGGAGSSFTSSGFVPSGNLSTMTIQDNPMQPTNNSNFAAMLRSSTR